MRNSTPKIRNGIKRYLNQVQGCWRRLKLQNKKEHNLQRRESRKTGGGKTLGSPSQLCKIVADVIPSSVNPLDQEFDDDAEVEPNIRRGEHEKDPITSEAGPSGLADEVITMNTKGVKVTRKRRIFKSKVMNNYDLFIA